MEIALAATSQVKIVSAQGNHHLHFSARNKACDLEATPPYAHASPLASSGKSLRVDDATGPNNHHVHRLFGNGSHSRMSGHVAARLS